MHQHFWLILWPCSLKMTTCANLPHPLPSCTLPNSLPSLLTWFMGWIDIPLIIGVRHLVSCVSDKKFRKNCALHHALDRLLILLQYPLPACLFVTYTVIWNCLNWIRVIGHLHHLHVNYAVLSCRLLLFYKTDWLSCWHFH